MPSKNGDEPVRMYQEEDAEILGTYVCLLYETWIGDRDDPAVQIEQWLSVFPQEVVPENYGPGPTFSDGTAPYTHESNRYWRESFEGLKGALLNESLKVVKETDKDAVKHQTESNNLKR